MDVEIDVEVTQTAAATVAHVRGEVDLATSPRLRETLATLDAPLVVVDLSEVTFLDSSGLSELIQAHEGRAATGGIRLVVATDVIRRVLEVSGLDEVFSTYDNVDDATRPS